MSREKNSKIEDIEQFRELKEGISNVETLNALSPFLKTIGIHITGIESLNNISELKEKALALISLPDNFNSIFAERGWIAYERLNVDVAKEAIRIAESESIDNAELYLANYYDDETLEFHLLSMRAIEAFRERSELLEKAKQDYLAERYHASVPIVLSCLDGIVNDVAKKNRGFFAEKIELELEAWNSISAHNEGLGKLVNVLQTSRRKTSTEKITIPYRHGILHGRDINFDNKLVAAKSWAALFSIRDWALALKHGRKPEEKEMISWSSLAEQLQQNRNTRKAIDTWKPRTKEEIQEIISASGYSYLKKGTPESKVVEFMNAWEAHNYGAMYDILPSNIRKLKHRSTTAGDMRSTFSGHKLIDYKILEIDEFAAASCKIKVFIEFEYESVEYRNELIYQLLYQNNNGDPAISRLQDGQWGFYPQIRY